MIRTRSEHREHLPANLRAPARHWMTRQIPSLAAALVISAVIAGASWAYGGIGYNVRAIVYFGAGVGCVLAFLGCWISPRADNAGRAIWPLALLPLLGGIMWGSVQLFDLRVEPPTLNGQLVSTPSLGDDSTGEADSRPQRQRWSITLYPAATKASLAWFTLAVAIFLAGTGLAREQTWTPWLLGALAVNGAALAFFGIAQELAEGSRVAAEAVPSWGKPFATFVNRNNAAGFLNISLAAAIGLFFWIAPPNLMNRGLSAGKRRDIQPRAVISFRAMMLWFSRLNAAHFAGIVLMGLCLAGVLASTSRGGVLAAAAGGLALAAVVLLRGTNRLKVLGLATVLIMLAVSLLRWSGLDQSVTARLSTLTSAGLATNGRVPHWQDALEGVREHWVLGTGMGTYRYAYLPYQSEPSWGWFIHAENQYLEAFLEMGLPGLLLLLAAIMLAGWSALDLMNSDDKNDYAFGISGVFALASGGTAAFFDFGLYLPANMLALAWLSGIVCGRAAAREGAARLIRLPLTRFRFVRVGVSFAIVLIAAAGYSEVRAASTSANLHRKTPALKTLDALPSPLLEQRIDAVKSVLAARPDDAVAHRLLATLQIYQFRQQAFDLAIKNREIASADQKNALWRQTRLETLYLAANQWHSQGRTDLVRQLAAEPLIADHLHSALNHLRQAKAACPILPRIDISLALLNFLEEPEQPAGLSSLHQAVLLAPANPEVLYRAGLLADLAGQTALADRWWRRTLEHDSSELSRILEFSRRTRPLTEILQNILPASPDLVLTLLTDPRFVWTSGERALVRAHCRRLHDRKGAPRSPRGYHREAILSQFEGDPAGSIAAYREALALDPEQLEWRLELAQLLYQENQLSAARDALRNAARQAPERADIRQRLEKIVREIIQRPSFELDRQP